MISVGNGRILFVSDHRSVGNTSHNQVFANELIKLGYDVFLDDLASVMANPSKWEQIETILVDFWQTPIVTVNHIHTLCQRFKNSCFIIFAVDTRHQETILENYANVAAMFSRPVPVAKVHDAIQHAVRKKELLDQEPWIPKVPGLPAAVASSHPDLSLLVGKSPAIAKIREQIEEAAQTTMNVLIRGESGTGKDVVASLIHQLSGRAEQGEFVKINCPSVPESLLESELFGHEQGAFTGAERKKPGRLEIASGGTVFLDEIGDIPPFLQAKLLQFIEQKKFTRVGGIKTIEIDTRIVSATNAPLEALIVTHDFRLDLFYRLNEYAITIPPLRDRIEDIPLLFDHFCRTLAAELHLEPPRVSADCLGAMVQYTWPGNIRELKTVAKRFVFARKEQVILDAIQYHASLTSSKSATLNLAEIERTNILAALLKTKWNQRKAATLLGVSYSTIRRKVEKYNLQDVKLQTNQKAG